MRKWSTISSYRILYLHGILLAHAGDAIHPALSGLVYETRYPTIIHTGLGSLLQKKKKTKLVTK